jgi:hypothetical protein
MHSTSTAEHIHGTKTMPSSPIRRDRDENINMNSQSEAGPVSQGEFSDGLKALGIQIDSDKLDRLHKLGGTVALQTIAGLGKLVQTDTSGAADKKTVAVSAASTAKVPHDTPQQHQLLGPAATLQKQGTVMGSTLQSGATQSDGGSKRRETRQAAIYARERARAETEMHSEIDSGLLDDRPNDWNCSAETWNQHLLPGRFYYPDPNMRNESEAVTSVLHLNDAKGTLHRAGGAAKPGAPDGVVGEEGCVSWEKKQRIATIQSKRTLACEGLVQKVRELQRSKWSAWRRAFAKEDRSASGKVTASGMRSALRTLGVHAGDKDFQRLMATLSGGPASSQAESYAYAEPIPIARSTRTVPEAAARQADEHGILSPRKVGDSKQMLTLLDAPAAVADHASPGALEAKREKQGLAVHAVKAKLNELLWSQPDETGATMYHRLQREQTKTGTLQMAALQKELGRSGAPVSAADVEMMLRAEGVLTAEGADLRKLARCCCLQQGSQQPKSAAAAPVPPYRVQTPGEAAAEARAIEQRLLCGTEDSTQRLPFRAMQLVRRTRTAILDSMPKQDMLCASETRDGAAWICKALDGLGDEKGHKGGKGQEGGAARQTGAGANAQDAIDRGALQRRLRQLGASVSEGDAAQLLRFAAGARSNGPAASDAGRSTATAGEILELLGLREQDLVQPLLPATIPPQPTAAAPADAGDAAMHADDEFSQHRRLPICHFSEYDYQDGAPASAPLAHVVDALSAAIPAAGSSMRPPLGARLPHKTETSADEGPAAAGQHCRFNPENTQRNVSGAVTTAVLDPPVTKAAAAAARATEAQAKAKRTKLTQAYSEVAAEAEVQVWLTQRAATTSVRKMYMDFVGSNQSLPLGERLHAKPGVDPKAEFAQRQSDAATLRVVEVASADGAKAAQKEASDRLNATVRRMMEKRGLSPTKPVSRQDRGSWLLVVFATAAAAAHVLLVPSFCSRPACHFVMYVRCHYRLGTSNSLPLWASAVLAQTTHGRTPSLGPRRPPPPPGPRARAPALPAPSAQRTATSSSCHMRGLTARRRWPRQRSTSSCSARCHASPLGPNRPCGLLPR